MIFMALVFNVRLHCLKCIVYMMMIAMLHTTQSTKTTKTERERKPEKPKHLNTYSKWTAYHSHRQIKAEKQISVNSVYICSFGVCNTMFVELVWIFFLWLLLSDGSQCKSHLGFVVGFYRVYLQLLYGYVHKIFISNISLVLYRVNIRKTWHCHCTQYISPIDDRDDKNNDNNNVHKNILFLPPQPSL